MAATSDLTNPPPCGCRRKIANAAGQMKECPRCGRNETNIGGCDDFRSRSSRVGEQNILFFHDGECVRFYLDFDVDCSSSLTCKSDVYA